jgi:hypothetical protein
MARVQIHLALPPYSIAISNREHCTAILSALCANVTWNTCLLEFTVQGSITHGSSTGFFDEPRSVDFEPGHPVRSP